MARAAVKSIAGGRNLIGSDEIDPNQGKVYVAIDTQYNSANITLTREDFIKFVKAVGVKSEDLKEPTNVEKIEAMKVSQKFRYGSATGYIKISDTHVVQIYKDGGGAVMPIREFERTTQDITIEED